MPTMAGRGTSSDSKETKKQYYELTHLAPQYVATTYVWDEICKILEKGRRAWEDRYTLEAIYRLVLAGKLQLWGFVRNKKLKLVLVTEVCDYPNMSELRFVAFCGSGGKKSLALLDYADIVAARLGCSKITFVARKGFERWLSSKGYKKVAVVLSKDVEGGYLH